MPPPQKIKMYYDPRGQVVHTVNPDGTEQRVIFGVPNGAPTAQGKVNFTPTPWESYTYDANDLTSGNYAFNTPKSALVDALGRTIKTTEHRATALAEDVVMQYEYDIRGNLIKVTDALDRSAFEYTYDLKPKMGEEDSGANVLRTWHIDKGIQTTLYDASFKPIEGKDAKGSWVLNSYDKLLRPTQVWGEDRSGEGIRLAQKMEYGIHEDYNNINKIIHQYDAAGKSTTFRYDFKGNLLESSREVLKTEKILEVFDGPPTDWNITCFKADWSWMDESEYLSTRQFLTDMSYDALNRIVTLEYPADTTNTRNVLTPHYNKAGALERVELGFTEYVNRIAYNAKGQRIMIAFGNGIMTRYAYDPQNFRLKRLKSEGYNISSSGYNYQSGTTKQDYGYFYDEVGNILNILDKTPEAGVGGSSELDRQFTYDPLYRLLSATGREHLPTESEPWQDYYRSEDRSTTSAYTRSYTYDKMSNIQELHHSGDSSFTRTYDYVSGTNKLYEFDYGSGSTYYSHDDNGNIIQETETRHFEWDYADRMRVFRNQYSTSEPTVYTQYFYDAGGNRVMKFTKKAGVYWEYTIYINGIYEWTESYYNHRQACCYVMDDKSRIASQRSGDNFDDYTPYIKYNLEDHLGSSMTLLDEYGSWVSWEEYYPFGETSLGSYAKKRYRFCGKERDEESGLYYYGARYYLPWLCRFASVDPKAQEFSWQSSYVYADNNPVVLNDINGEGTGEGEGGGEANGNESNNATNPNNENPIVYVKIHCFTNKEVKEKLINKIESYFKDHNINVKVVETDKTFDKIENLREIDWIIEIKEGSKKDPKGKTDNKNSEVFIINIVDNWDIKLFSVVPERQNQAIDSIANTAVHEVLHRFLQKALAHFGVTPQDVGATNDTLHDNVDHWETPGNLTSSGDVKQYFTTEANRNKMLNFQVAVLKEWIKANTQYPNSKMLNIEVRGNIFQLNQIMNPKNNPYGLYGK